VTKRQGNLGSIPGEGEIFHYTVQTSSGDTLPHYTPPPSAEVNNSGSYTSTSPYAFMARNGTD